MCDNNQNINFVERESTPYHTPTEKIIKFCPPPKNSPNRKYRLKAI